jgi:hypothetical protein
VFGSGFGSGVKPNRKAEETEPRVSVSANWRIAPHAPSPPIFEPTGPPRDLDPNKLLAAASNPPSPPQLSTLQNPNAGAWERCGARRICRLWRHGAKGEDDERARGASTSRARRGGELRAARREEEGGWRRVVRRWRVYASRGAATGDAGR